MAQKREEFFTKTFNSLILNDDDDSNSNNG